MQGTTLKASTFIAAQISARLVLNGMQALLVLAVTRLFFGVEVRGSGLTLIAFVILGAMSFMTLGSEALILGGWLIGAFIIASYTFKWE
jgi:ABC-2 type transport system permease protein